MFKVPNVWVALSRGEFRVQLLSAINVLYAIGSNNDDFSLQLAILVTMQES